MWSPVGKEMGIPGRALEGNHWQMGEVDMANVHHLMGIQRRDCFTLLATSVNHFVREELKMAEPLRCLHRI